MTLIHAPSGREARPIRAPSDTAPSGRQSNQDNAIIHKDLIIRRTDGREERT